MSLSGRLLPAHPKPLPDELLSSWIVRLAHANGLKLQPFCDRVFGKNRELWNRDIDRSAPQWLLQSLAERTGTPLRTIHSTTLGIYAGTVFHRQQAAGQLRWILPAGIYHRKRRRFGIQFCPQCLGEDTEPYFRTRWRVAALTFCPVHRTHLQDRCPACAAPIAFHRRELGRPSITEGGPVCLCHACGLDLRLAETLPHAPYEASIARTLEQLAAHVAGESSGVDIGHLDVLHQICKIMVSRRNSAKLFEYVTSATDAPCLAFSHNRQAFELRPIVERQHVIQLASWVLAEPAVRLHAALQDRAIRLSDLTRDFRDAPSWYSGFARRFNRHARSV